MTSRHHLIVIVIVIARLAPAAVHAEALQESEQGITHSFLACGGETYIADGASTITWRYPHATRDGWVLSGGRVLLALSKSDKHPHGAVVEVDRDGQTLFTFAGTQSEVDTVEPLANGNVLLTESGAKPRLVEVNRKGKIVVEVPLQAQAENHHMQTRMARKLPSGDYLVPHLLDRVLRQYTRTGKVVWEARTPDTPAEAWPFTAIRLTDGHTLTTCTHANMVLELDRKGRVAWQVDNAALASPLLADPCGAQRLPNGNTVIASYGARAADAVKLLEITRDRKVVWTFKSGKVGGIHHVQILDTNGRAVPGRARR